MSLPGAFSPTRMRLDMMQSAAKSELNFFVAWKSPRSTRSELANLPNAAWHLNSAIWFSARSSYRLDRYLPRSARRSAPLKVTSLGIGTMALAVLSFEFGPTSVELIQRVLSRVQHGLSAYQMRGICRIGWIFQFRAFRLH